MITSCHPVLNYKESCSLARKLSHESYRLIDPPPRDIYHNHSLSRETVNPPARSWFAETRFHQTTHHHSRGSAMSTTPATQFHSMPHLRNRCHQGRHRLRTP